MVTLTCPKGCARPVVRYTNGVAEFSGPNAFGSPEQKQARQIAVPGTMLADFNEMVGRTTLREHPPTLEFYGDLHGVGGMFVPDQWVILVGMKDQEDIASGVIARWPQEVMASFRRSNGGRWPDQASLFHFTLDAAIRRCMAHELGHALLASGYGNPYAPDEEAGADYYAGKFDALRGLDPDLGEMFFYSIGCTGPSCRHPDPQTRATAYRTGYDEQQRTG